MYRGAGAAARPAVLLIRSPQAKRAAGIFPGGEVKIGRILHPSPANPAANRDWAGVVVEQLRTQAIS